MTQIAPKVLVVAGLAGTAGATVSRIAVWLTTADHADLSPVALTARTRMLKTVSGSACHS